MSQKKNQQERPAFHGSDIEEIERCYKIPAESIVKFGANVNPFGLSENLRQDVAAHLDLITTYPDRDYKTLRQAIAAYCRVPMEHVMIGNGSTELISLLISTRHARHALVIGPTYSEYQRELALTGGRVSEYLLPEADNFRLHLDDLEKALANDTDLVILCNPNNPTSSALNGKELRDLLDLCRRRQIFVMADETYVEFAPDPDNISAVPLTADYDNLMVLRGVSKFFAAPGLRLGYGITSNETFLKALKDLQNPWTLNSIAAYAGTRLLADQDYIAKTRSLILSERDRILQELNTFRYAKAYPAYANFILVRILRQDLTSFDLFEAAIRQGMMIRDCSSFAGLPGEYIRFCIMMPEDNTRLLRCLANLLA